jgi:hypothetical protein
VSQSSSIISRLVFDLVLDHQIEIYVYYRDIVKVASSDSTATALCSIACRIERAWRNHPILFESERAVRLWQQQS